MAPRKLLGALTIKGDAILAAVHFERREIQNVLILPDPSIKFVNPLVQPVLLAFLQLNGGCALQFSGGQFFELFRHARGFGIQFARFARQHLTHNAAHLVADFGIATSFGRLAFQRT